MKASNQKVVITNNRPSYAAILNKDDPWPALRGNPNKHKTINTATREYQNETLSSYHNRRSCSNFPMKNCNVTENEPNLVNIQSEKDFPEINESLKTDYQSLFNPETDFDSDQSSVSGSSLEDESNDQGWITVSRKPKKEREPYSLNVNATKTIVPPSLPVVIEAEKQEKRRLQQLKREKVKEERKRKREEKAKQLREQSRRDTKVTLISQDLIDTLSRGTKPHIKSNYNSLHNFSESSQISKSLIEYPSLSKSYELNRQNDTSFYHHISENIVRPTTDLSKCFYSNEKAQNEKPSVSIEVNPVSTTPNTKDQTPNTKDENISIQESPVKKKVKSTDLINLEIMDLIQLKKKEKVVNKVKPKHTPPNHKIEKRGKKSEGKTKKLSVLKKNILRQTKTQIDLLSTLVKEQATLEEKKISSEIPSELTSRERSSDEDESKKSEDKHSMFSSLTSNVEEEVNISEHSNKELRPSPGLANAVKGAAISSDSEAFEYLVKEIEVMLNPFHNNRFREYCTHVITPEIDQALKEFIPPLIKFQDRMYHKDPMKAKVKRRFYCGLKETLKHIRHLSCIIMAPNLKPSPGKGCVDELVHNVLSAAEDLSIPVFFGLSPRKLGQLCHKRAFVSCMSITNIQGAQDKFERLMELVPEAKLQYQNMITKRLAINPPLNEEGGQGCEESAQTIRGNVINSLIEKLKQ